MLLAIPPVLFAKAWFIGYALVFLGIALGLAVVCRPSKRKAPRAD